MAITLVGLLSTLLLLPWTTSVGVAAAILTGSDVMFSGSDVNWLGYKQTYNKSYSDTAEESYRYNVWLENLDAITLHNLRADKGEHSYWLSVNDFADMTDSEFEDAMLGMKTRATDDVTNDVTARERNASAEMKLNILPQHVDWRENGYVTPVKFQGRCGSCYAFSVTGALEGQHAKKTGKLVSLSEQNILDCTHNLLYGNHGCHGGYIDHSFMYVENHGVDTEASYPYDGRVERCRFNRKNIGASCTGYKRVLPRGCEYMLQEAVADVGPISIGIDAKQSLKQYGHGVYSSAKCSSHKLNHGVLVVGYGTTDYFQEYWIVKNSWGQFWGEAGYFRLLRNADNMCGVATMASYPLV